MDDFNGKLNVVTLKDYVESVINGLEKNLNSRIEQMDRAVIKAESTMNHRLEGMNEFRQALGDQNRTFMPRAEIEKSFTNINNSIRKLEKCQERIENMKQGGNIVWAYVLSGVSLMTALIALVIKFTGGS